MKKYLILKLSLVLLILSAFLEGFSISSFADEIEDKNIDIKNEENLKYEDILGKSFIDSFLIDNENKDELSIHFKSKLEAKDLKEAGSIDGKIYFFSIYPYEEGLKEDGTALMVSDFKKDISSKIKLNLSENRSLIYSAVAAFIKREDGYMPISNRRFIENPEVFSKDREKKTSQSKKGLLIELNMVDDAMNLGVCHVETNIAFNQILGSGIKYEFEGKEYEFDSSVIAGYDRAIEKFSSKDLIVTAILLNGWNENRRELYIPGTLKKDRANYYQINVMTKEGFDTVRAISSFLAERYNGKNGHGKVTNWVVGNEINNQIWNYENESDISKYVKHYQRAFRTIYTSIKLENALSDVYMPLDYYWTGKGTKTPGFNWFAGKDILDKFNEQSRLEGNFNWKIAAHPYPCHLNEADFWNDAKYGLTKDMNTPIVNFYNISVLTSYLRQEELRDTLGEVRHIMLTEQGFSSKTPSGENIDLQAAAFAYAYYIADSNPYIDAFILSRQVDAPSEVRAGLSFGLYHCYMDKGDAPIAYLPKHIYYVFKDIDNKNMSLKTSEFAKKIIGINRWSDVISGFRYANMER